MSRPLRLQAALAAAALAASAPGAARADDLDVRFSGYGTLAATHAHTDAAEFRSSWRQHKGSRGQTDFGVDSRLGGQVNVTLDDTWSGAAQLLALRRDGRDRAVVEWFYGQAELTTELSARVGRLALPAFMLSDVRNVGYAQHWVRTPNEVYLGLPVTSVDGGQLLYRTRWGGTKITVQPTVGQADTEVFFDGGAAGAFAGGVLTRDVRSLNLTAESGAWTWRFGQTVLDAHLAWRGGIVLPADSFKYTFTNVGLTYDNGALLVMAELMDGKTSNGRFDTRGFYTSTGYRLGAWMPYVTHARVAHRGSVVGANPPSVTQAIGLRWDAWKDIALKAQAERSRLSGQQFINTGAGVDRHRSVNVYTFSVDFVF